MNLAYSSLILVSINLGLLWLLMAAPVGVRTLKMRRHFTADPQKIWSAVHPLGENAAWHPSVIRSSAVDADRHLARQAYSHMDRRGRPIERVFEISGGEGFSYSARVVEDSALDSSFWRSYREQRLLVPADDGVDLVVEQTDRYRGLAFLIFRYFALRRELSALDGWLASGKASSSGIFERPPMQLLLAVVSTLMLWPFFGINLQGLILSSILTVVIVLHELGHMAAYRAFGHRSAKMIFVPLLGGIAIGGRPYNTIFEVATCALMGAGMSAFLVPASIAVFHLLDTGIHASPLAVAASLYFILILGAFNLLNLLPMRRFDGGQVLRQIFPGKAMQMLGSFGITGAILVTGWEIGLPGKALMAGLAVFTLMSLIGAGGVKPREALDPMSAGERLMAGLGLYAAVIIHSYAVIFACERLFG